MRLCECRDGRASRLYGYGGGEDPCTRCKCDLCCGCFAGGETCASVDWCCWKELEPCRISVRCQRCIARVSRYPGLFDGVAVEPIDTNPERGESVLGVAGDGRDSEGPLDVSHRADRGGAYCVSCPVQTAYGRNSTKARPLDNFLDWRAQEMGWSRLYRNRTYRKYEEEGSETSCYQCSNFDFHNLGLERGRFLTLPAGNSNGLSRLFLLE